MPPRLSFDPNVSQTDLYQYFFPAWEACAQSAVSVMCAATPARHTSAAVHEPVDGDWLPVSIGPSRNAPWLIHLSGGRPLASLRMIVPCLLCLRPSLGSASCGFGFRSVASGLAQAARCCVWQVRVQRHQRLTHVHVAHDRLRPPRRVQLHGAPGELRRHRLRRARLYGLSIPSLQRYGRGRGGGGAARGRRPQQRRRLLVSPPAFWF